MWTRAVANYLNKIYMNLKIRCLKILHECKFCANTREELFASMFRIIQDYIALTSHALKLLLLTIINTRISNKNLSETQYGFVAKKKVRRDRVLLKVISFEER